MKEYKAAVFIIGVMLLICSVNAQYWFQYGATGDQAVYQNTGAAVSIQTIYQPYVNSGSLGFWTGENLANGAFLQIGYVIENQSGEYPDYCNQYNCTSSEYIKKGNAEWFYEYFLPNSNSSGFTGAIGPDGSAGTNGTFNRYSFYYSGGEWHFLFNGNVIGSVNLGTGSSGNNAPVAFGEVANTTSANIKILPVIFSNLSFYNSAGAVHPVPHGYSYIGYGVGSEKALQNPYGVKELSPRINYFEVGSGLPQNSNGYQLWSFGYRLSVVSGYGNANYSSEYQAYSAQSISEPKYVYINGRTREAFQGWAGTGAGSYSGPDNSTFISIAGNITERAEWKTQYLININSTHGAVSGTGWYDSGSAVHYSAENYTEYYNRTVRYVFAGWSNGNKNLSGLLFADSPGNITAIFNEEYYVNASSKYGRVEGVGWYVNGTDAALTISNYTIDKSKFARISFYQWSNGSSKPNLSFTVEGPVSLNALFMNQYLAKFDAMDAYGNRVFPSEIYIDGQPYGRNVFLFPNQSYNVTSVYYDGMQIALDQRVSLSGNGTIFLNLPLYDVNATFTDLFGNPVNPYVYASFANGTSSNLQSEYGRISFVDLPYGKVNISATYSGITEYASASMGSGVRMLFFSPYDIAVLVAIVAVAFVIYFISRSRLHRKR